MNNKLEEFLQIWGVILLVNQIFIFGACFYPTCIIAALPHTGVISFFVWRFLEKEKKKALREERKEQKKESKSSLDILLNEIEKKENEKTTVRKFSRHTQKQDPLKVKGDIFEKYIGKKFENKGELVIYNGFLKGYEDKGVDIISLSVETNTINLIQCKNWTKKSIFLKDIQSIYQKLSEYYFDYSEFLSSEVNQHLHIKKSFYDIEDVLQTTNKNLNNFTIRKTLYLSSDKVIDLNIGRELMLIKPNIFRYKDMKIVVHGINYKSAYDASSDRKREVEEIFSD